MPNDLWIPYISRLSVGGEFPSKFREIFCTDLYAVAVGRYVFYFYVGFDVCRLEQRNKEESPPQEGGQEHEESPPAVGAAFHVSFLLCVSFYCHVATGRQRPPPGGGANFQGSHFACIRFIFMREFHMKMKTGPPPGGGADCVKTLLCVSFHCYVATEDGRGPPPRRGGKFQGSQFTCILFIFMCEFHMKMRTGPPPGGGADFVKTQVRHRSFISCVSFI